MRWATAALFSVGLSCSRLPNPTPLGGTEWEPPAPITDRRPRGEGEASGPSPAPKGEARAAERTPAAAASSPPSSSVALSASPNTSSAAFAFKPYLVGDKVELKTHYAIHASANVPGLPMDQSVEIDTKERIEVRITEVSSGELREVEVEYLESQGVFNMGDSKTSDNSNKGKRYRVNFAGPAARVSTLAGTTTTDDEKGVVFDLFSVSGYLPLVQKQLPTVLNPGWNQRLGRSELDRLFGKLETVHLESAWIRLGERDATRPDVWSFQCGMPVKLERDGMSLSSELTGSILVRATETRPIEISLRGPLTASLGTDGPANAFSGNIEVTVSQSYSARR